MKKRAVANRATDGAGRFLATSSGSASILGACFQIEMVALHQQRSLRTRLVVRWAELLMADKFLKQVRQAILLGENRYVLTVAPPDLWQPDASWDCIDKGHFSLYTV
jgi:hypothetical protein